MDVTVPTATGNLAARLSIPADSHAAVVVVEEPGGAGLEREIAELLNRSNIATLLTDGLTASEHRSARHAAEHCSNIVLIAERLTAATDWLGGSPDLVDAPVGYFAAGTAASAALWAAAERPAAVKSIVALDARPLLAAPALARVRAPTLFITRRSLAPLASVNRAGFERLMCEKRLETLDDCDIEHIAALARAWFTSRLRCATGIETIDAYSRG